MAQALPGDAETLKTLLLKERAEHAAALLAKDHAHAEIERLRQIIKEMQRHRFGRRAETLNPDQLALSLEDVEQEIAAGEAGAESVAPTAKTARAARRRANRGSLPAHLPRIETVVDIEDKTCPGCPPLRSRSLNPRWGSIRVQDDVPSGGLC